MIDRNRKNPGQEALPDFVIIGAGKCGTTALWKELKQHPDICGSREKETNFFGSQHGIRDLDWYQGLFADAEKIKFEASPDYTSIWYSDLVPQRMYKVIPDARLIFIVRHPVKRTISRMLHRVYKNQAHYGDLFNENYWKNNSETREAIMGSHYHRHLTRYLEYYDLNKTLILTHEDLLVKPNTVYNKILAFVGLEDTYYKEDHDFLTANVTSEKKRVTWRKAHWRLRRLHQKKIIPPVHRLFEESAKKPSLPSKIIKYIWSQVQEDLVDFENLTGRTFGYKLQDVLPEQ